MPTSTSVAIAEETLIRLKETALKLRRGGIVASLDTVINLGLDQLDREMEMVNHES